MNTRLHLSTLLVKGNATVEHPDSQALSDWPLYGPRDEKISELVELLAVQHSLRLDEIENLMIEALQKRVAELASEKA